MSTVICEKQFSIQVVGIRPPTNYWKLQSINGGSSPASVGAMNLTSGANNTTEAGGIIGPTCINLGGFANGANSLRTPTGGFQFNNLTAGFTLRFWVKCDQPSSQDITDLLFVDGVPGVSVTQFDFLANSIFQSVPPWGVQFMDTLLNNLFATDTYPIDSSWHRVVIICDKAGNLFKWKMDNQATITTNSPNGFFSDATNRALMFIALGSSGDRHLSLSEVGLWQEILLTESELLLDWNSGNGTTFP